MLKYGSYSAGVGNANRIVFNPYFVTADQSQGLVIWTTSYERIRRVNEFLSSMSKYSTYNEDTNKRYEAQIRFIRAFLYYQLLLRTNTVIIFDKLPDGNSKPLSPESDCWDFVEQDLDYAIQNLPVQWDATRSGRITKGAALAMKSRAMLLAKRWKKRGQQHQKLLIYKITGVWYMSLTKIIRMLSNHISTMETKNLS